MCSSHKLRHILLVISRGCRRVEQQRCPQQFCCSGVAQFSSQCLFNIVGMDQSDAGFKIKAGNSEAHGHLPNFQR